MEFDRLIAFAADTVGAAQRRLPPELRLLARDVAVHYERLAGPDLIAEGFPPDILGLFTGVAYGSELTQEVTTPPQIILFIESLWDFAEEDLDTFREEVRVTYLHELGHYLGWDEDEVAARGLE